MACATAPQDLFHRQAKRASATCAGDRDVAPAAPHRQAHRRRGRCVDGHRLAASCARLVSTGSQRWSRPSRSAAIERENPGETDPYRHQKARPFQPVGHRITGDRTGQSTALPWRGPGWEYVHVCIDDAFPRRLQSGHARTRKGKRRRLPQGGRRLLREPRRHGRACHDRQRLLLPIHGLPSACKQPRPQAHPHQALHAQDQRQGRTLHPNRLARMGLCHALQHLKRTRRRAAELAPPLQLAQASWRHTIQTPISRLGLTGNNLLRLHN